MFLVGAVLGNGAYFAANSGYSCEGDQYASPNAHGERFVIQCRVILGDFCKGRKDLNALPDRYDSVCDVAEGKPSIIVSFNDPYVYPEYVIKFRRKWTSDIISYRDNRKRHFILQISDECGYLGWVVTKKALISISIKQARFRFEFNTYMYVLFFIDFLQNLEERVGIKWLCIVNRRILIVDIGALQYRNVVSFDIRYFRYNTYIDPALELPVSKLKKWILKFYM